MIRIGLVGVSGYGRWHLKMIDEQVRRGRACLVAATVPNQEQELEACSRLEATGVRLYRDHLEMFAALQGQADLVMLPTGIHWHTPMTLAALDAGLHVLVEKPLAASLDEIDRIDAARRAAGRLVAVGFQELYSAATHDVKRKILEGEIGALRQVNVVGQWPRPLSYYARNEWAGRRRVGDAWVLDSPVSNAFAHFILLALFWAGEQLDQPAQIVTLDAEMYRAQPIETFDTVSLVARTAGGVSITFNASHSGEINLPPEIRVVGEEGEIRWTLGRHCVRRRPDRPDEVWPLPSVPETRLQVLHEVVSHLSGEPASFLVEPPLARVHTELVQRLDQSGEPQIIPADVCVRLQRGDETFISVPGMDPVLRLAADRGCLLSHVAPPWAAAVVARGRNGS